MCVPIDLLSTFLNPVWCWSSVCPHRPIVNLPQPSVMWPVYDSIELLSFFLNSISILLFLLLLTPSSICIHILFACTSSPSPSSSLSFLFSSFSLPHLKTRSACFFTVTKCSLAQWLENLQLIHTVLHMCSQQFMYCTCAVQTLWD